MQEAGKQAGWRGTGYPAGPDVGPGGEWGAEIAEQDGGALGGGNADRVRTVADESLSAIPASVRTMTNKANQTAPRLGTHALNRATLARQLLLHRAPVSRTTRPPLPRPPLRGHQQCCCRARRTRTVFTRRRPVPSPG